MLMSLPKSLKNQLLVSMNDHPLSSSKVKNEIFHNDQEVSLSLRRSDSRPLNQFVDTSSLKKRKARDVNESSPEGTTMMERQGGTKEVINSY